MLSKSRSDEIHEIYANKGELILDLGSLSISTSSSDPQITNIFDAAKEGDLEKVKFYLNADSTLNAESTDEFRRTVMSIASEFGRLNIVQYYFEVLKANVEAVDSSFNTCLHYSCMLNRTLVVRYLVGKANANIHATNNEFVTPFHYLAQHGNNELVRYFIAVGANLEARDVENRAPLNYACDHNQHATVLLILEAGRNAKIYGSGDGILHWICERLDDQRIRVDERLQIAYLAIQRKEGGNIGLLVQSMKAIYRTECLPLAILATTNFLHLLPSPIAFLNSEFIGDDNGHSRFSKLIFTFLTKENDDDSMILFYLVHFIHSLNLAAKLHPSESDDICDIRRKIELVISEIYACDIFDNPQVSLRLLQPFHAPMEESEDRPSSSLPVDTTARDKDNNVKVELDGGSDSKSFIARTKSIHGKKYQVFSTKSLQKQVEEMDAFRPNSVVSYCLAQGITVLFDKPHVNGLVSRILYLYRRSDISSKAGDVYYYSLFAHALPLILTNTVTQAQLINNVMEGELSITLKEYFEIVEYTHCLRTIPAFVMFTELLSKVALLYFLAGVVIQDYGKTFGANYSSTDYVHDDTLYHFTRGVTTYEAWLIIMSVTDILFEVGQLLELKDIHEWFHHSAFTWNSFDVLSGLCVILWMILRFCCSVEYFSVARVVLTLTAIPMSIGLLRYLSVYKPLGELVMLIRGMGKELINFAIVYLLSIVGFGIAFYGLFAFSPTYNNSATTFLTLIQNTLGNFDFSIFDTNSEVVSNLGVVLLVTFVILSAILLMNLLIAQMSNSYQQIKDQSQQQWSFTYAKLVSEYILLEEHNGLCSLPAPLNGITSIIWCIEMLGQFVHRKIDPSWDPTKRVSLVGTISNLFYSYSFGTFLRLYYTIAFAFHLVASKLQVIVYASFSMKKVEQSLLVTVVFPFVSFWLIVFDALFLPIIIFGNEVCGVVQRSKVRAYFYWQYIEDIESPSKMEHNYDTHLTFNKAAKRPSLHPLTSIGSNLSMLFASPSQSNLSNMSAELPNTSFKKRKAIDEGRDDLIEFSYHDIERILRPLKSYIKSLSGDEMSRLESNVSQETLRVRKEVNKVQEKLTSVELAQKQSRQLIQSSLETLREDVQKQKSHSAQELTSMKEQIVLMQKEMMEMKLMLSQVVKLLASKE